MGKTKKARSVLKPSIEHLSDADCRKLLDDLVHNVQSYGPLNAGEILGQMCDDLEKNGVEWDHDKIPPFRPGATVCLVHAHACKGTVVRSGVKKTQVRWDDDGSVNSNDNDDIELV